MGGQNGIVLPRLPHFRKTLKQVLPDPLCSTPADRSRPPPEGTKNSLVLLDRKAQNIERPLQSADFTSIFRVDLRKFMVS